MGYGKYSEAINYVGDAAKWMFSPYIRALRYASTPSANIKDKSLTGMARAAFHGSGGGMTQFGEKLGDGSQAYNAAEVAKGIAGLGLGYRFLSGGGAYRDSSGNTDIAGIPFV